MGPRDVKEDVEARFLRVLDVDCPDGAVENSAMEEVGRMVRLPRCVAGCSSVNSEMDSTSW